MNLDGYVHLTLGLAVLTLVIFIICFCILVTHLSNPQGWKRRDQREGWFWNIRHSQDSVRIIHTQARMDIFQDLEKKCTKHTSCSDLEERNHSYDSTQVPQNPETIFIEESYTLANPVSKRESIDVQALGLENRHVSSKIQIEPALHLETDRGRHRELYVNTKVIDSDPLPRITIEDEMVRDIRDERSEPIYSNSIPKKSSRISPYHPANDLISGSGSPTSRKTNPQPFSILATSGPSPHKRITLGSARNNTPNHVSFGNIFGNISVSLSESDDSSNNEEPDNNVVESPGVNTGVSLERVLEHNQVNRLENRLEALLTKARMDATNSDSVQSHYNQETGARARSNISPRYSPRPKRNHGRKTSNKPAQRNRGPTRRCSSCGRFHL